MEEIATAARKTLGALDSVANALKVGDSSTATAAVVLAAVTIALVTWRLLARRSHNDRWAGILTVAIALVALAVPAALALWWVGAVPWAFWWSVAVALTAAALASTEWLRASLRWFAVLAAVALVALLLRLGWASVDDARCAEVHKLVGDVAELNTTKAKALDEARSAATKTREVFSRSVQSGTAVPGLVAPGNRLLGALNSGVGADLDEAIMALDAAYHPNAASRADTALVTAADNAVAAVRAVAALQGVESPDTVANLETRVCRSQGSLMTDAELTAARSATATYRNRVQPTDNNDAAAEEAAMSATEAAARAARGESDPDPNWVSLVDQGATVAGAAALGWLPGSPEPDKWFWVALAVLLLGGWWWLERRSASMVAGPVSVTFHGVDPQEADKANQPASQTQQAVFVTALTKNLREPGSTPGSQTSSPLTDLEGIMTAAGPTKILAAAIAALKKVLSAPRGSTVNAQVIPPLPGDKRWRVFVVVADAATGKTLAAKELPPRRVSGRRLPRGRLLGRRHRALEQPTDASVGAVVTRHGTRLRGVRHRNQAQRLCPERRAARGAGDQPRAPPARRPTLARRKVCRRSGALRACSGRRPNG
ncbi:hypothetical protein E0H75_07075 [Kribbella capetownensis]|uniref:Uncharacterized protein n=1 Tax=Kribbella capetownensis TaxID=1572659 RepID=A0A4R0K645_9ACTN|nr:hypothetical protein [Kribbella capetownensis]TCC53446.1 hypothetical protein E0H75_07075 [Kribbella capetownensis]